MISLSHLSHASFLLHVFFDMVPDAALGEEVSSSSLFKLLIGAIFLQGQLHDPHSLKRQQILRRQLLQINSAKQSLTDGFIVFFYARGHSVKGIVDLKMKILSWITLMSFKTRKTFVHRKQRMYTDTLCSDQSVNDSAFAYAAADTE